MKTFKRIIPSIILIGLYVIMISSCSSNNEDYSQELEDQVSALQTQNALLQENLDSQEIQVEAPQPPSGESSGAVFVEKTPTIESLPTNPVPAGQPIIYNGWAITVSKELYIQASDNSFGVSIFVRNLGDTSRVFRYLQAGIMVTDDLGNEYEVLEDSQCEEYLNLTMNLEVNAEDSETIQPQYINMYCSRAGTLPLLQGPISLDATQLIVHFTNFGPYNNVEVVIDL